MSKRYEALLVGGAPETATIETAVGGLPARTRLERIVSIPHAHWGALSHVSLRPGKSHTHSFVTQPILPICHTTHYAHLSHPISPCITVILPPPSI